MAKATAPEDERQKWLDHLNHALANETARGHACVGDVLIDELLKQVFVVRLVDDKKETQKLMSESRPLGSHGTRLRMAYCLGWIGPMTFRECNEIHRIRNKMAHDGSHFV